MIKEIVLDAFDICHQKDNKKDLGNELDDMDTESAIELVEDDEIKLEDLRGIAKKS